MVVEVTVMMQSPAISVQIAEGAVVSSSAAASPRLSIRTSAAARIATVMLCGAVLVGICAEPSMICTTELIYPITRAQLKANFITLDCQYVMTADGRLFYVQED